MNADTDYTYAAAMVASALRLADRAVIADVIDEGVCHWDNVIDDEAGPVYDISGMFNEHEHSPMVIDMAKQGIAYGVARGLLELLPGPPIRVRVLRMPA